jgi:hypothetical protein
MEIAGTVRSFMHDGSILDQSRPAIGKTSEKCKIFWPGRIWLAYEELLMLRQGESQRNSGMTAIGRITEAVARKATAEEGRS